MDLLINDLKRRHGRAPLFPLGVGDEMFAIDLLVERDSDTHPRRMLMVDPFGVGAIRISTCYPDPNGECLRPVGKKKDLSDYTGTQHERLTQIKVEYAVSPALVWQLKMREIVLTGKEFKIGPNEYVLSLWKYLSFRKRYPDFEYAVA